MRKLMLILVLGCLISGCVSVPKSGDPNDGTRKVLDPNNPALVGVEAGAEGLGAILTAFGVPIGSLLIGAAGVWRGLKPKIIAAQKKADEAERQEALAKAAAQTTVDGVELLKKESPESWQKLKPIYEDMVKTAPSIEAYVRELRGLPVDK